MHWILAVVGAFVGYLVGDFGEEALGLVLGILVGWLGGRLIKLWQRVNALERQVQWLTRPAAASEATTQPAAAAPESDPAQQPAEQTETQQPMQPDVQPVAAPASTTEVSPAVPPSSATPPPLPAAAFSQAPTASSSSPADDHAAQPQSAHDAATAASSADDPTDWPASDRGFDKRITAFLRRALLEGNVPVKIGALVLFFGVAAGLKYAADQGYFSLPIEVRLIGFAVLAIGVLLWGWRHRQRQPAFGLSLQGLGIGLLLLIVFTAFGYYHVLPAGLAFALVLLVVAAAAMLAVLQDAAWLAALGWIGGFLAPVLIATGSNNPVALFSYYALLNAAVFAMAWWKPWRLLNLIGFTFTFVIGGVWGWQYYQPEKFATVEPFLILYFLFYTLIPVLYALRQRENRSAVVDGTLVFGTPLLAFPMQAALLVGDGYGLAFSALAMAMLYALLAWWLIRRCDLSTLGLSFAGLGFGFATLAVPLALSANWTAAAWALEGAALVWLGRRQDNMLQRLAGLLLQVLAAGFYVQALVDGIWRVTPADWPILNSHSLTTLCLAAAAGFVSWSHDRHRPMPWLSCLGLIWASVLWTLIGAHEITGFGGRLPPELRDTTALWLLWLAASALLVALLRARLSWYRLGYALLPMIAAVPLLALFEYIVANDTQSLLGMPQVIAWLVLFAVLAWTLRRMQNPRARALSWMHVGTLGGLATWLGLGLLQWGARATEIGDGWLWLLLALPLAGLAFGTATRSAPLAWPLREHFGDYRLRWLIPAALVLGVLWLVTLVQAGDAAPIAFVPLLNPLELMQAGLLAGAFMALRSGWAKSEHAMYAIARNTVLIAAFLFVTVASLRAVHHLHGVPWDAQLLTNNVAQTTLTVVWSVLGVVAWVIGSRRQSWAVWLLGAILMGVVLVKLVLVDRQNWGNLAGIISFLAVGGLLVLVGKLAPTPPRHLSRDTVAAGETA